MGNDKPNFAEPIKSGLEFLYTAKTGPMEKYWGTQYIQSALRNSFINNVFLKI
jgi:hypothetical protein